MEAKNCNKDYANKVSKFGKNEKTGLTGKEQWFKDHEVHGTHDELNTIWDELIDKPEVKAEKAAKTEKKD